MSFWGVVVKPGKVAPFVPPPEATKLHVSQASLSVDAKPKDKARLVVKVEDGHEFVLCVLREGQAENASLDIVIDQYAEFTVVGNTDIHLTGYLMPEFEDDEDEEHEHGEHSDEDSESDEDGDHDSLDSDEFSEDEESEEEEEEGRQRTMEIKEIFDEPADDDVEATDDEDDLGSEEEEEEEESEEEDEEKEPVPVAAVAPAQKRKGAAAPTAQPAAKQAKPTAGPAPKPQAKPEPAKPVVKETAKPAAAPKKRTFPNGFEIETLKQGMPDSKYAKAGKTVSVRYTGRLKSNGKVFDATKGNKAFNFRLGVGEVIKGWDRGVDGMRVGDKRRLIIPPAMAYGSTGAGKAIPPNAWLDFEVELVNVK